MRGEIKLPIKIGRTVATHTFLVCDTIDNEFLLGVDVMRKLEICIDIPNRLITVSKKDNVPFFDRPHSLNDRLKIRNNKTITIPAHTALYVMGKIPIANTKHSYEGVIDPYHNLAKSHGIVVTGTMSYSKENLVPIHCMNLMPHDVTIYKNQLIAFIEPYERLNNVEHVNHIKSQRDYYDASIDLPRLPTADPVSVTREKGKWDNPDKLIKQLRVDSIDIPAEYKQELKELLKEYSHVFSRDRFDLGCASFYEARLTLKRDFTPKWVPSRPVSYKLQPYMDKEIKNLANSGQISPCRYSLWNSAVFLVEKKGGSQRFVVDARSLNSQCIQDKYELPKISTILDNLPECNWLSQLDFTNSFSQIPLQKESRHLTAFTHNRQRYQWNRLIQGQTSSSAEFSRAMNQLFSRVPFNSLLIYVDDLLCCSSTIREHLKRLRFIFERLTWGSLKLSTRKSNLLTRECTFLGHKLSNQGIRIDPDKIKAISELPTPGNAKGIQKFLGALNFHRKFIPRFAEKAAPLYNLLRKDVPFNWCEKCETSFQQLKADMTSSHILALPDISDPDDSYQVVIDSSKLGHAAVLTQRVNGQRRIISYFSKSVPKHQQKYGATKLEFLGLVAALKNWRIYLQSARFVVKTDCLALLNLETISITPSNSLKPTHQT